MLINGTGPRAVGDQLVLRDGTPWLAEGETPDDGALAGMNFFVEGITAELPK